MTCEYMAQQEGVLCEEVLLLSETNEDVCVKVKVHARVMGEVALRVTVMCSHVTVGELKVCSHPLVFSGCFQCAQKVFLQEDLGTK